MSVVNLSALIAGDLDGAFRYFRSSNSNRAIFRGWILHPQEYRLLYSELLKRAVELITDPDEYEAATLFPKSFPHISSEAVPATWIDSSDPLLALEAARRVGDPPYYIKDFAKSAKEIFPSGCLVSGDNLLEGMTKTIRELQDFRADRFEGGIVIRPFVKLRLIEENPFGGETFDEYRLFYFQKTLISKSTYARIGGDVTAIPDYPAVAQSIDSPFFTIDVAVTEDFGARILEIGDGGSSALPPTVDPRSFWLSIVHIACERQEWANQAPEPTIMTVTPRAPSSTSRASHDRGSS